MNKILYRYNEDNELLLVFFMDSETRIIHFDGSDFTYRDWDSIKEPERFTELEFSKKARDKNKLQIEELRHDDQKVFFVKLATGDIFEIKVTIHGSGEISQKLFVLKKKKWFGKYDNYEQSILNAFYSAKKIVLNTL